ncbi:hypothetical protein [Clostridium felsineum]|uniref:hypothetical protein n=1 Tax=Clostridium felsineum TaxID=36839 RepID=UPI00098BD267|nr:hypothetical protein [Clostridium felsineum]URZ18478.1 hypothetical protein CLFE_045660 [Clostridium felsineum DSM 794]
MLIAVIIISIAIVFIEGIPLIKAKKRKEFITVLTLSIIAVLLVLAKSLNIVTPMVLIRNLLYPLGRLVFRSL